MKKHLYHFAWVATIIFTLDLSIYYIRNGHISCEEINQVLILLLLTGLTIIPLQIFLDKKKKHKE